MIASLSAALTSMKGSTLDPKYRRQRVRAEPGVLTDTAIVEHGQLVSTVRVTVVCHPIRRFRTRETDAGMRSVAERLVRRTTAAAQRHPRTRLEPLALGVHKVLDVGHEIRPVQLRSDPRCLAGIDPGELPDLGSTVPTAIRGRELRCQVLERGGRLVHLARYAGALAERGSCNRKTTQPFGEEHPGRDLVWQQVHVAVVAKAGAGRPSRQQWISNRHHRQGFTERSQHGRHQPQSRA